MLVEGINRIKKHTKVGTDRPRQPRPAASSPRRPPIHVSNVQLVDPETKKPTRVGIRVETVERDGRTKAHPRPRRQALR